jgi:hypothetical protein
MPLPPKKKYIVFYVKILKIYDIDLLIVQLLSDRLIWRRRRFLEGEAQTGRGV